MTAPQIFNRPDKGAIAYHRIAATGAGVGLPPVVFLGGFNSDMTGTKATWLEQWCVTRGRGYLRFDYTGHGQSDGRFLEGSIGQWAGDAADALAGLTEGKQILVGSSMGGWISLLLARRSPERVAGLVGIAAAPDFTEDLMWARFGPEERATLARDGKLMLSSEGYDEDYAITTHMIEEGRQNFVLRAPLAVNFPVRLLQGSADADVPVSHALRLMEHIEGPDVRLHLVKGADHRFSEPRELEILGATLEELTEALGAP
ncbi:MAG: alpha/beta hydrolase [Pseudomonadota bacterium]